MMLYLSGKRLFSQLRHLLYAKSYVGINYGKPVGVIPAILPKTQKKNENWYTSGVWSGDGRDE